MCGVRRASGALPMRAEMLVTEVMRCRVSDGRRSAGGRRVASRNAGGTARTGLCLEQQSPDAAGGGAQTHRQATTHGANRAPSGAGRAASLTTTPTPVSALSRPLPRRACESTTALVSTQPCTTSRRETYQVCRARARQAAKRHAPATVATYSRAQSAHAAEVRTSAKCWRTTLSSSASSRLTSALRALQRCA
jgi:hypothetical protein